MGHFPDLSDVLMVVVLDPGSTTPLIIKPPVCPGKRSEETRAGPEEPLTVRIVLTFGAVDFPFLVDAKEELLVGEEFPPAHVSLEVVVAAPHVAPHHRRRRRVGRPGQPGGRGVRNT